MNEYKPIIAINLCTRSTDDMFYIRRGYLEAIENAGGVPVCLPLMAHVIMRHRVIELGRWNITSWKFNGCRSKILWLGSFTILW